MKVLRYALKALLCVAGVFLIYLILGGLLPFVKAKKVDDDWAKAFDEEAFYGNGIGPDRAAVIEDSTDALDIRIQMFEQAKERIVLSTFSIKIDRVSEEVMASLLAAANRGVKVQLLIDGLSGGVDMKADPMYYAAGTHPNIEIRYYNIPNLLKPWTLNSQLHDKFVLIDDTCLLLGGRNTSNYFLGDYNSKVLSYDREIFVYNTAHSTDLTSESVMTELYEYFEHLWTLPYTTAVFDSIPFYKEERAETAEEHLAEVYQTMKEERPELFAEADYEAFTVPTNRISLITNPTNLGPKEPLLLYQLSSLMTSADERVFLQTPYAVLNRDMYTLLRTVAQTVPLFDMLLNSTSVGDNFMASSDYTFNRDKVLATGVTVHEYQGDHSTHNKSVLIDDDISVIGSFNFDMRSVYIDTESMLVVHGEEFNQLLEQEIFRMKEESLEVAEDGSYLPGRITPAELSSSRKLLFRITSVVFQLFRFLL
ncbi:MAG: phosphatidylserine/phosphatidylglycerophosphate/cardiolipin synthase family protein [Lachnospiraceae bacterium]|nr:phosphatidylserine/phosphatidylglycerophosphate/cardiolipin synthase family protein [Lachnospiraceae bacterium]